MQFSVAGTLEVTSAKEAFVPQVNVSQDFSLVVMDNRWKMLIVSTNEPLFDSLEIGYESGALYYVAHSRSVKGTNTPNQDLAIIESQFIPKNLFGFQASSIWAAFLAGIHLPVSTNSAYLRPLHNVSYLGQLEDNFTIEASWSRDGANSHILREISFYEKGVFDGIVNGHPVFKKAAPPFDSQFVRLKAQCLSITNLEGLVIPSSVLVSEFAPPLSDDKDPVTGLLEFRKSIIHVSSLSLPQELTVRPLISNLTTVADRRQVQSHGEFAYTIPASGKWMETNSPEFKSLISNEESFKSARVSATQGQSYRRFLVISGLAVASLVFIYLLFRFGKR